MRLWSTLTRLFSWSFLQTMILGELPHPSSPVAFTWLCFSSFQLWDLLQLHCNSTESWCNARCCRRTGRSGNKHSTLHSFVYHRVPLPVLLQSRIDLPAKGTSNDLVEQSHVTIRISYGNCIVNHDSNCGSLQLFSAQSICTEWGSLPGSVLLPAVNLLCTHC